MPGENAEGRVATCPQCRQRIRFTANGLESVEPAATVTEDSVAESSHSSIDNGTEAIWHVHFQNGDEAGPVTDTQLQHWVAEERITGECQLWRDGWDGWKRASEIIPAFQNPVRRDDYGFLADLDESSNEEVLVPDLQTTSQAPVPLQFSSPQPQFQPATAASGNLGNDRHLVASLAGTRPWTVLFAVSVMILAALMFIGLSYTLMKSGGRLPGTFITPIVMWFIQATVLLVSGCIAFSYNSRIGAFVYSGSSSRLTAAMNAQRSFWALIAITAAVTTLFVIYILIQVIQFIGIISDIDGMMDV